MRSAGRAKSSRKKKEKKTTPSFGAVNETVCWPTYSSTEAAPAVM